MPPEVRKQLLIGHFRIGSIAPSRLVLPWASIDSLYVDDKKKELTVDHLNSGDQVIRSVFKPDLYNIREKSLLKRQVKVFADRYRFDLTE